MRGPFTKASSTKVHFYKSLQIPRCEALTEARRASANKLKAAGERARLNLKQPGSGGAVRTLQHEYLSVSDRRDPTATLFTHPYCCRLENGQTHPTDCNHPGQLYFSLIKNWNSSVAKSSYSWSSGKWFLRPWVNYCIPLKLKKKKKYTYLHFISSDMSHPV